MTQDKAQHNFSARVNALVSTIPIGKVMTYGQIAGLCGNARAARIVGGIAHFGDPELPWQRVVNAKGGLASGYPGGRVAHRQHLEAEGVVFDDNGNVNLEIHLWNPHL